MAISGCGQKPDESHDAGRIPCIPDPVDAGADGGAPGLAVCGPRFSEVHGHVAVLPHGGDARCDVDYEFEVGAVSASGFVLSGATEGDDSFELEVTFPAQEDWRLDFPPVGSSVLLRFCTCSVKDYARVSTLGGEIIWEGGDAACSPDGAGWADWVANEKRLQLEAYARADVCMRTDGMTAKEYLAICPDPATEEDLRIRVRSDQCDDILIPGEDREIVIGARRYLASAQGAVRRYGGACAVDFDGDFASAFIARLALPE